MRKPSSALPAIALAALAVLLAVKADARGPARRGAAAACAGERASDVVAGIDEAGEVTLASGRTVRLAGIRLPEDGAWRKQALSEMGSFVGTPVVLSRIAAKPDRWGRHRSDLARAGDAGGDLGARLVRAGLAVVDAGFDEDLCREDLLAVEDAARRRRSGLWAQAEARPAWAGDPDGLTKRLGRFTLVEGRVRSVGERATLTYLNFGGDWSRDTTVVLSKRAWREALNRGLNAQTLKGRRVRVRGIVRDDRGPRLDLASADLLEVLETDRWTRPDETAPE